jgi:hypothetical protein
MSRVAYNTPSVALSVGEAGARDKDKAKTKARVKALGY